MNGRRGLGAPLLRAVNLAFALALNAAHAPRQRPRVGVLDLDIFGPSIPKLMALEDAEDRAKAALDRTAVRLCCRSETD